MKTIGIAAADAPGAAAMIVAGPEAPLMNAVLGGLRALKTLALTVDADEAEAMKMTSTEVLHVNTTGHTMNQAHVAAQHPAPPPDLGPKVKRASPGPTAPPKTSTRHPAPRNSLWGDLRPAPTPDPCPGHALAPGPGQDASLEVTKLYTCLPKLYLSVCEDVSVQLFDDDNWSVTLSVWICFYHHIYGGICCQSEENKRDLEIIFSVNKSFCCDS